MKNIIFNKFLFSLTALSSIYFNISGQSCNQKTCCMQTFTASAGSEWYCVNNNDYKLVYHDEFDGKTLDKDMWNILNGLPTLGTNTDPELQYYSENNILVENGLLKLQLKKEHLTGKTGCIDGNPNACWTRDFDASSGWIFSKVKMPYNFGRITARIKVNNSRGVRPAFWLYNGFNEGEIDIFEFDDYDNLSSGVHYNSPTDNEGKKECALNYNEFHNWPYNDKFSGTDDFHIYTCDWNPSYIYFYIDGELWFKHDRFLDFNLEPFGCPTYGSTYLQRRVFPWKAMTIKLNVKVKNVSVAQESTMEVDYIRAYYKAPCTQDVVIDNASQIPNNPDEYNVIIGRNVTINCPYTMSAGQYLKIVALNKIELGPNFTMSPGSYLQKEIVPGLCDNPFAVFQPITPQLDPIQFTFNAFPNPTSSSITISSEPPGISDCRLDIFDVNGKLVLILEKVTLATEIALENFETGLYFINISKDNNPIKSLKISVIK